MYILGFLILCLFGPILGYLFGSIMFAIILTKHFANKDIREFGSKNPGFTNSLRIMNKKYGFLILILDICKTILPIIIIFLIIKFLFKSFIYEYSNNNFNIMSLIYLTGFGTIIGHLWPIFFKFKGGKGVASYIGILITMSPFVAIISCLIILIIVFQKQIMSLGSILVLIIAPFLILCPSINYFYLLNDNFINTIKITINNLLYVLPMFLILLILSSLIIYKHKNNIINLIHKKENKLNI